MVCRVLRLLRKCLGGRLPLVLILASAASIHITVHAEQRWSIERATLESGLAPKEVQLPHLVTADELQESGGRLTFRGTVEMADVPTSTVGVYIPKMSLSGNLYINGHPLGSCAPAKLEELRCLHQPNFYETPATLWMRGVNVIEVQIYATSRQMNGLSTIVIGDAHALFSDTFRWHWWGQVTLLQVLTWINVCLGLLSLAMAVRLRTESVYLWFGLACQANALSNVNGLVVTTFWSPEWFSWFVFSTRLVSAPLLILSILHYFDNRWPYVQRWLKAFIVAAPLVVALSENSRSWVMGLHVSNLLMGLVVLIAATRWSLLSGKAQDRWLAASLYVITLASVFDWLRLSGDGNFLGVYLISYLSAGTLMFMGGLIASLLVQALETSRELTASLEHKVALREEALAISYRERIELEQEFARTEERERLMRDMHDGFGSSLASTRMLLSSGKCNTEQASQVLAECMDDLRLLLETSSNQDGLLSSSLVDYRYRTERSLAANGIRSEWRTEVLDEPTLSSTELLQIMRVVQEAVNNAARHGKPSCITVGVEWDSESQKLCVRVSDDGLGLQNASGEAGRGRGMNNMKSRARIMGAHIFIAENDPGLSVELCIDRSTVLPTILAGSTN